MSSSSLDDWDPMTEDYKSPYFNSYDRGPGSLLPLSCQKAFKDEMNTVEQEHSFGLYVTGLPSDIIEPAIREIFAPFGKVLRVFRRWNKSERHQDTSYAFIDYGTFSEALAAIQGLHKKPPLNLKVTFSMSKEEKQQKLEIKQRDLKRMTDKNYKVKLQNLNSASEERTSSSEIGYDAPTKVSDEVNNKSDKIPCKENETFNSSLPRSNIKNSDSLCKYCLADQPHVHVIKVSGKGNVSETVILDHDGNTSVSESRKCALCKAPSSTMCSGCQDWYCSVQCQRMHWPSHKEYCINRKDDKKSCSASSAVLPTESGLKTFSELEKSPLQNLKGYRDKNIHNEITSTTNTSESDSKTSTSDKDSSEPKAYKKTKKENTPGPKTSSNSSSRRVMIKRESLQRNNETPVIFSFAFSPSDIWLRKTQHKKQLEILSEKLQKVVHTFPKRNIGVGDFCIIKSYKDNRYYRGQIVDKVNDACKVRCIDYGNIEWVTLADLKEIPHFLTTLPAQAIPCALAGVRLSKSISNNSFVEDFPLFVQGGCMAEVINVLEDGKSLIKLKTVDGDSVSGFLLRTGMLELAENEKHLENESVPYTASSKLTQFVPTSVLLAKASSRRHSSHVNCTPERAGETRGSKRSPKCTQFGPKNSSLCTLSDRCVSGPPNDLQKSLDNVCPSFEFANLPSKSLPKPILSGTAVSKATENERMLIRSALDLLPLQEEVYFGITSIENPSEKIGMTARIVPVIAKLSEIQSNLTAEAEMRYDIAFKPGKGDYVAAFSRLGEGWYRAFILEKKIDGYSVIYVDYGNVEDVDKVFPLNKEELSCSSALLKAYVKQPTCPLDVTFLNNLKVNDFVSFFVKSVRNCEVELSRNSSSDVFLIGRPWYYGVLGSEPQQFKTIVPLPTGFPEASESPPVRSKLQQGILKKVIKDLPTFRIMAADMKSRRVDFGSSLVTLVKGETTPSICLHLLSEKAELKRLMLDLNRHFSTCGNLKPYFPVTGEMVCVQSLYNLKWHRAKVESFEGRAGEVALVDYGYREEVHVDNIQPLPEVFKHYPFYSIPVELEGVHPDCLKERDRRILELQQFEVKVVSRKDSATSIRLYVKDACINDMITGNVSLANLVPPAPSDISIGSSCTPRYYYRTFPRKKLYAGQIQDLVILSVITPSEILCIVNDDETTGILNKFYADAVEYNCKCSGNEEPYVPRDQEICFAKCNAAGDLWLRCVALEVKEEKVDCLFIDFGHIDCVSVSDVRQLPSEFAHIPRQVIRCAIEGVPESTEEGEESIAVGLKEFLSPNSEHRAKVISEGQHADYVISFIDIPIDKLQQLLSQ